MNTASASIRLTYLVCNAHPIEDLEESLTKPLAAVRIIDTREAEQGTLELPLCRCSFLNPMPCDSKIAIGIACLPGVTRYIDLA
jgi:hypothetical protein